MVPIPFLSLVVVLEDGGEAGELAMHDRRESFSISSRLRKRALS